jgi:hypothetical protein
VSAATFGSDNTGTFTVTPPAADAKRYATAGTATLIISDGAERSITKPLELKITPVAYGTTGACSWTLTGVAPNYTLAISGSGAMDDYVIKGDKDKFPPWFMEYHEQITTAVIAGGVTHIGDNAFYGCVNLTAVTLPNSVTAIGDNAFYGCGNLTAVTLPNSVTAIGKSAFSQCSALTAVILPNSVITIGDLAFSGCSGLTAVTIPNSITAIGEYAFNHCTGLTTVTIPNSVTTIGEKVFNHCSALTSVTIPNSVITIGDYAFFGCSGLTAVTIGNKVETIGESAFNGCSALIAVTIPNSVETIGSYAFQGCSALTSVTIGSSAETIGEWAFNSCTGLREITSLNPVPPSFDNDVFLNVTTGNITLKVPANAVSAYKAAWGGFGSYFPIYGTNDKLDIAFAQPAAFNDRQPQDIVFTVTSGYAASLTAVDVPYGWTVSAATFSSATNTGTFTVTPPAADAKRYATSGTATLIISDGAERSITKPLVLKIMPVAEGTTGACSWTITGVAPNYTLTISGSGAMANYASNDKTTWRADEYRNNIKTAVIADGVTHVGNAAFYDCSGLTAVAIPNSVTTIGERAFQSCSGLTAVTIPN